MKNEDTIVACVSIIFIIAIAIIYVVANTASCGNKSVSFDEHEYKILGGCMVKHNDRWIPLENIRGFDDKG